MSRGRAGRGRGRRRSGSRGRHPCRRLTPPDATARARAAQRDDRLSGRAAGALALGRQRLGARGLRPVRGRRRADRPRADGRRRSRRAVPRRAAVEGPRGAWTARFASLINDEPRALHWDSAGLLVVAYGFHSYGLETATGEARWDHRSATPILALLGSPRLAHVLVQAEIETFAIEPDGIGRLAGGPLGGGDRGRAGRWPARADRLRRAGQRSLDPATGRSAS